MKRKWKYAPSAEAPRFCTECCRKLRKEEVLVCDHCFANMLLSILGEDDRPKEYSEGEDEE